MAVLYDNSGKIIQIGGVNEIWDNSGLVYKYQKPAPTHDYSQDYLTFEAISAGTFSFNRPYSYSVDDGSTWTSLAASASTPTVNAGDKILFKATNEPNSSVGVGTFSATSEFNAMGNPYSMFSGDSFTSVTTLPVFAVSRLFYLNTNLVSAENLSLPALDLGSETYSCYYETFMGCTSLTTAPELPATSLHDSCYHNMFSGCTSLTTAPALPATTLSNGCYSYMFDGCTSLTTAPELLADTLTATCYIYMFSGCTSLNYVKMTATNVDMAFYPNYAMQHMLTNASATGTFVKAASVANLPTGDYGVPTGWTIVDAT